MSIDSTRAPSVAAERRLSVPWLTVLPFAAAMAYADGFWMVALRSAVGSIQRSQEPFTTWLRESTLAVPFYLFAVLGALTPRDALVRARAPHDKVGPTDGVC